MATKIKSIVICQLCSKPMKDPRMLPCLHSFCFQCLIKHISQELKNSQRVRSVTNTFNVSMDLSMSEVRPSELGSILDTSFNDQSDGPSRALERSDRSSSTINLFQSSIESSLCEERILLNTSNFAQMGSDVSSEVESAIDVNDLGEGKIDNCYIDRITCPECSISFQHNRTVSHLPFNPFVSSLSQAYSDWEQMNEKFGRLFCSACIRGTIALARCGRCCDFLCKECLESHKTMKVFQNHALVYFGDHTRTVAFEEFIRRKTNYVTCQLHKDQMRFYCDTCSVLICRDCTVLDHPRESHKFMGLHDAVRHFETCLKNVISSYTARVNVLENSLEFIEKSKFAMSHDIQVMKDKVRTQANDILSATKEVKDRIFTEIEKVEFDKISKIQMDKDLVKGKLENAEHVLHLLKYLLEEGNDTEVAVLMYQVKNMPQLEEFDSENFLTNVQSLKNSIKFSPGHVNIELISHQIGQFVSNYQPLSNLKLLDFKKHVLSKGLSHPGAIDCHKNQLAIVETKNNWICMINLELLVSDVFDTDSITAQQVPDMNDPSDIILLPNSSSLIFIQDDGPYIVDLITKNWCKIQMVQNCGWFGGTVTEKGQIWLTNRISCEIQLLFSSKIISTQVDEVKWQPHRITCSELGLFVIAKVEDKFGVCKSAVLHYDFDGSLLNIFQNGLLMEPFGICIDQQGYILVTDSRQDKIFAISTDESSLVTLMNENIKHPCGLCRTDDGSIVFVDKSLDGFWTLK